MPYSNPQENVVVDLRMNCSIEGKNSFSGSQERLDKH